MTKISEKVHWDNNDKTMVVQETHDFTPILNQTQALRSAGVDGLGKDNKLVARVPMAMMKIWAKKWGVSMSDTKAMQEVLKKELLNSENSQFRVWGGTF